MILVTGAAGKTGKAVVKALAAKGANVRALVRRPEHAEALRALRRRRHQYRQLRRSARAGAAPRPEPARSIISAPMSVLHEVAYARAVAAAAQAQNVARFVYHSVLHPQIEAMPHHWQKMRAEEMLFAGGFDLTILQPTAYMQNILGAWRGIVAEGVFRVPYPVETRLSLVDLEDVAEAAALVLTTNGHSGATYELVGTSPLSQTEVAAAIGEALGRETCVPKRKPSRPGRRGPVPPAWASTSA